MCLVSACLWITFTIAQTPADLVGTWQAESNGVTYLQVIFADGSYTFEAVGQNYLEQGTWQFDGTNYSQQWHDPNTGEAMNETYRVEFLNADSFKQSGGNLQGQIFTFARTDARVAPEQPTTTSPDLVGIWEAPYEDVSVTQIIQADGTYTFKIPESDTYEEYFEEGSWQFDGANYSQQYRDPNTGEAVDETYSVEFLGPDSFRQFGGNLGTTVFTFTRVAADAVSTQSPTNPVPDQTATNPLDAPNQQNTPENQNTPSPTPDQLAQMGIDPETMLIPDEFYCYLSEYGDNYSDYFILTILPNERYSFDGSEGDYEIVDTGSLIEVAWRSGPFASEDSYAFAGYNDYGQTISVYEIPYGEDTYDLSCYQRGPRNDQLQLELAFRDVQPGSYSCVNDDDGTQGPTLEILENRIYRIDGREGEYQIDLMSDPEDDIVSIDYLSGAWAGGYGSAIANEETGMREVDVITDAEDYTCSLLGAPLQGILYGSGVAPAPPSGAGGLEGFYASWEPDMSGMGLCGGGICWDYLYFFPNGYVYKERPDGLLENIDCTRTQPNGLPLCDVYTLEGNTLYFSDGERKPLAQTAEGLELDGDIYSRIPRFDGLVLNGIFEASSFTAAVGGQGGLAIEKTITFYPDGTFTREGFVGASYTATDTGTQFGDPVAGVTTSSESSNNGTYQIQGNAITFNYADGQMSTDFFFVIPGEDPANPGALRIGSWDFLKE